jgi:hypothetical protein
VFVSGSALLVDCEQVGSFFPRVYDEDWLFLADRLAAGVVSAVGECRQLPYDPYVDPRRATAEEFGDVLAEGLVALLHQGRRGWEDAVRPTYWDEFLYRRRTFLERVASRVTAPWRAVHPALGTPRRRRAVQAAEPSSRTAPRRPTGRRSSSKSTSQSPRASSARHRCSG